MDNTMFVKIEDYKEVASAISLLKTKVNEAKQQLARLNDLKDRENQELGRWQSDILDIEKKIMFIDQSFFTQ